jgi:hypothetical protein
MGRPATFVHGMASPFAAVVDALLSELKQQLDLGI